jgi:hypothetical protein
VGERPISWGAYDAGRAAVAAGFDLELVDGPLHVVVSADVSATEAGQVALLGFLNMTCRVHRPITLELSGGTPLRLLPIHGSRASRTLEEVAVDLVRAVNPECSVWLSSRPVPEAITVGFGPVERRCRWYVGVQRAIAAVSAVPPAAQDWLPPGSRWGGALGACLAANAAFRSALRRETANVRLSAWNWAEGDDAALGPDGPISSAGGSKLLVGAGSVAGALAHWLHYLGAAGTWSIVDRDTVSESNLVKGLNLAARDVGRLKAQQLAELLPAARWEPAWYDGSNLASEEHDLVLCLANERDVRSAISTRDPVLILHATTGENWDVFLHRHIRNRDDCIACRTRDVKQALMACSSVALGTGADEGRADTALPFAAGLAGLTLASALARLEAGVLGDGDFNHWAFRFDTKTTLALHSRSRCRKTCPRQGYAPLRPGRWLHLDPRAAEVVSTEGGTGGIRAPDQPQSAASRKADSR